MKYLNATQIRVGNYVSFNEDIIKLDGSLFAMYLQNELDKPFYPVKLTDKWLTDFGFTNSKTQDKFYNKDNNVGISTADDKFRFIQGNFVCQLVLTDLEYVHQLQNIFYSLYGTELFLVSA